jgi:hypothetical protein
MCSLDMYIYAGKICTAYLLFYNKNEDVYELSGHPSYISLIHRPYLK